MGRIIVSTNMSLDGVVQDPDGLEGTSPGGWFGRSAGADLAEWTRHETDESMGATALLLGRRSDAWFAERWNARTGDWADQLNRLPKFVVSSTIDRAQWANGSVIDGADAMAQVAALKARTPGDILVYASYQLVRALLDAGLVDEVRLVVFPVVVGSGERRFGVTSGPKPLRLIGSQALGEGLVALTYRPGA